MKSFVADGTGAQQTLTESQDNKIPVYEDESAVEADLANLTEGQIVATKDTGSELSAPVDVAQSGNMHAVTSNAVAESLSYSTTEQATGGKWIDGKPIYRKVYNYTNATLVGNSYSILDSNVVIPNIGIVTKITVLAEKPVSSGILRINCLGYFEGNSIGAFQNMTGGNDWTVNFVIEYTKSTD